MAQRHLLLAIALLLPSAAANAQRPDGGPDGGRRERGGMPGGPPGEGGRTRMQFDSDDFFNRLSNGKDVINRADLQGWQQMMFDRMASQAGISGGSMSRDQFKSATEKLRAGMMGGAAAPGGAISINTFSRDGSVTTRMPDPADIGRMADERFRRSDRDGDGLLQVDEMSERLKADWQRWDKNKDGAVDASEHREFFQGFMNERTAEATSGATPPTGQSAGSAPAGQPGTANPPAEDDGRPIVYKAGKLPQGIPSWFASLDADKDGQVGLYEWVKESRGVDEFRSMDRNDDAFVTVDEVMSFVRGSSRSGSTVAANSTPDSRGAMSMMRDGRGEPMRGGMMPGGGFGGGFAGGGFGGGMNPSGFGGGAGGFAGGPGFGRGGRGEGGPGGRGDGGPRGEFNRGGRDEGPRGDFNRGGRGEGGPGGPRGMRGEGGPGGRGEGGPRGDFNRGTRGEGGPGGGPGGPGFGRGGRGEAGPGAFPGGSGFGRGGRQDGERADRMERGQGGRGDMNGRGGNREEGERRGPGNRMRNGGGPETDRPR